MRDHSLLYVTVTLPDEVAEVADQFVALPIFQRAVARAGLSLVVLAPYLLAPNVAGDERRGAWTTRSEMRSRSKWEIFLRN